MTNYNKWISEKPELDDIQLGQPAMASATLSSTVQSAT
jgi:hypothetical protein